MRCLEMLKANLLTLRNTYSWALVFFNNSQRMKEQLILKTQRANGHFNLVNNHTK